MRKILLSIGLLVAVPCFADTLKIGAPICLTGGCAEWGESTKNGLTIALESINNKGGVLGKLIEIIYEDTNEATGGFKAVTAFQKLKSQGNVNFFIGPTWTPGGLAVAPVAGKMKDVLMISPSLGVAQFNESAPNLFNTMPHSETSTRAVAKLMIQSKINKAAIFSSEQPWESLQAKVFREEFTRLGGEIVSEQSPNPDAADLRTESLKIASAKPQAVFLANLNQAGLASRQLRMLGFQGSLYAALLDQTRIDISQGTLEGAISAQYPEGNEDFVKQYVQKFGKKPNASADTAHDALIALSKALEAAGSFEAEKILPELIKVEFQGASGYIKFDSLGGVVREPVYVVVKSSKLEKL